MERLPSLLTIAPVVAVAMAVLFLLGYWLPFGVFPLPLLGFQELVSYSALPLAAVIMGSLASLAFIRGDHNGTLQTVWFKRKSRAADLAFLLLLVAVNVITIGLDGAFKAMVLWIDVLLLWIAAMHNVLRIWINRFGYWPVLGGILAVASLGSSWAFGMALAHDVLQVKECGHKVFFEERSECAILVGPLGEWLVFLDAKRHVIFVPIKSVERTESVKVLN